MSQRNVGKEGVERGEDGGIIELVEVGWIDRQEMANYKAR